MDNIYRDFFEKENISISTEEINAFIKYKELLLEWNEKINLTAITDEKEIIYKHFIDSLLIEKISEISLINKKIIDVGTGAGFPGLPLAIMHKDLQVTLSDSLKKRIDFLRKVTTELQLTNTQCCEGRAEDLGKDPFHREGYDFVVARAVSKLPVLLEYTIPFVKMEGFFIAYKGPEYEFELKESEKALKELGAELYKTYNFKIEEFAMERNILLFKKIYKTPSKYPRRAGMPIKKPL